MGLGPSKQEHEATLKRLQAAERQAQSLSAEKAALEERVQEQAAVVERQQEALAAASHSCAEQLAEKDEQVAKAVKQRELAEELRRSDALLAKRLLHAQLKYAAGAGAVAAPDAAADVDGGAMAAAMALAAQDELQLRQMLMHTTNELEAVQRQALDAERAASAFRFGELKRELWLPELCDVSMMLRSSQLVVLGGVRLPRPASFASRGSGLSPGLAVMRHLGTPSTDGQWAALGGSLLFDAQEREVSALRLALCAQPAANQLVSLSFDHTGGLTGSVKTKRDSLSARLFGTLDLNRKGATRAGLEMVYDVDGA